jgi:uncharacterized membrane protein
MERLMAVVFDNESKAYEGLRALNQLDDEGSITAYAAQVIQKTPDGKISEKQTQGNFPLQTSRGFLMGSLLGLLGGPVGLGIGAVAGTAAGEIGDLNNAGLNMDFVNEVSTSLTPGKFALVADVNEEWVTPVDTRMEALRGSVFRTARSQFEADQRSRDVAELKSEVAQMKAEHAQARAEDKAKLQGKLDKLNIKLQNRLEQARLRLGQMKTETDAKVQALQKQAAKAQGDTKARIDARIAQMRENYNTSTAKLKNLAA